jgi:hypothetical protein
MVQRRQQTERAGAGSNSIGISSKTSLLFFAEPQRAGCSGGQPASLSAPYLSVGGQPPPSLRLEVQIFSDPEGEKQEVREVHLGPNGITLLA